MLVKQVKVKCDQTKLKVKAKVTILYNSAHTLLLKVK